MIADLEALGAPLVGQSLGQKLQHFQFAGCQRFYRPGIFQCARRQNFLDESRFQRREAGRCRRHCRRQAFTSDLAEEKAARPARPDGSCELLVR